MEGSLRLSEQPAGKRSRPDNPVRQVWKPPDTDHTLADLYITLELGFIPPRGQRVAGLLYALIEEIRADSRQQSMNRLVSEAHELAKENDQEDA